MRKHANFGEYWGAGWPDPGAIERYFVGPQENPWFREERADSAGLTAEGVGGTDHLQPSKGRVDIHFYLTGHRAHGVSLCYQKWGGGYKDTYYSKGDLGRLREFMRNLHGRLESPVLFIPFDDAWRAVKDFIESDGALPKSIDWIKSRDLPPETFPDPGRARN
jgi:hypothetical protein